MAVHASSLGEVDTGANPEPNLSRTHDTRLSAASTEIRKATSSGEVRSRSKLM